MSGRPSVLPQVRAAMVGHMRFRDRVCFAAVDTIAQEVGCCRRAVQYAIRKLERDGEIEERPDLLPHGRQTRCWRFRNFCTLRSSSGETRRTPRPLRFAQRPRRETASARCGRRRRLMEQHPDLIPNEVVRKSGEVARFNAGDAIAATVEMCQDMGIPLAPQVRARLGKGAKALLDADFSPRIVVASCVHAVRTGWFGSVETIGQEMVVAMAGERVGREEHKRILAELSHRMDREDSVVWQAMREEMRRRAEPKEIQ